jgi:hypothetical protein
MKNIKIFLTLAVAALFTSSAGAQIPNDMFGRNTGSSVPTSSSPSSFAPSTSTPKLIQRDRNTPSAASAPAAAEKSNLQNQTRDAVPMFLNGSADGNIGWTGGMGAAMGFAPGLGLGGVPKFGYVFRNNLYVGGYAMLNMGTINSVAPNGFPSASGFVNTNTMMLGVESGREFPFSIARVQFINRVYGGVGLAFVNFSAASPQFALPPQQANQTLPNNGVNMLYQVGNLFYVPVKSFFTMQNLMVGVDARYINFGGVSGFIVGPSLGFRLF